jgi:hypothetical protein
MKLTKNQKRAAIWSAIGLAVAGLAVIVIMSLVDGKSGKALERIEIALDDIRVTLPVGYNPTSQRLGELLSQPEDHTFPSITLDLDFERILADVEDNDFSDIGDARSKVLMEDVYRRLGHLFDRTDNLEIRQRNSSAWDRFNLPDDMREQFDFTTDGDFPINISRFLTKERNKRFRLVTEFGSVELYSEFFFGKSPQGDVVATIDQEEDTFLHFGYTEEEDGTTTIHILLKDSRGIEKVPTERPGKSLLLTLPLTLDFMQGTNNNLLYNAVRYTSGSELHKFGTLPRSFVDTKSNNMYVFVNRLGRFQPFETEKGSTTSSQAAEFLSDREIHLETVEGSNGELFVTRGSMYAALLRIHWFETFEFHTGDTIDFPDVFDPDLRRLLTTGRSLGVVTGRPTGGDDREPSFFPDAEIYRSELFTLLARYIQVFEISANGIMPRDPRVEVPDTNSGWWVQHFTYLDNIGFIPYRINNQGENELAADKFALLHECEEVLFMLLTTMNF